jgi:hypothetical protein
MGTMIFGSDQNRMARAADPRVIGLKEGAGNAQTGPF